MSCFGLATAKLSFAMNYLIYAVMITIFKIFVNKKKSFFAFFLQNSTEKQKCLNILAFNQRLSIIIKHVSIIYGL